MSEGLDEQAIDAPPHVRVPLRRNRNWRLLWTGQLLSDMGSMVAVLAYPLLVFHLTGNAAIAGAVGTVSALGAFLVRLPAGALADRHDRRRVMLVVDGLRAVVLALLAAGVLLHVVGWPAVLVVALLDGLGSTLFTPAIMAAIPLVVDGSQLEDAWASIEAQTSTAGIVGKALGGVLIQLGMAIPFLADAISYGVSSIASARLRGDFAAPSTDQERRGLWHESMDGLRHVWGDPLLKAVIIQAPLINLMFNGVVAMVTLGLAASHTPAWKIGVASAAISVGTLLGAIAAPRMKGRFTLSQLVVVLTGSATVCVGLAAVFMPSPLVAIPLAVPFFLSPPTNAALIAAMLRETPPELQGRVGNTLFQLATGLATVAPLIAGLLVEHVSIHLAMGCFAVGMAACTVLAVALPGLRAAEAARAA